VSAPIEAVSNKGLRKFPIAFEEQMHGKHVCDVLPFQDSKIESKAGKNRYYKSYVIWREETSMKDRKEKKKFCPEREKEREKHGW
jgi:hypothetical protein